MIGMLWKLEILLKNEEVGKYSLFFNINDMNSLLPRWVGL